MVGAFRGNKSTSLISWLSVLAFIIAGLLVQFEGHQSITTFDGLYRDDAFGVFMKTLCLGASRLRDYYVDRL